MQLAELRYARNRRRLDVAARLIDFEARTGTIRRLTGLTDSRIRTLLKECGVDGRSGSRQRHRGSSPHSVSSVLAKGNIRNEAAALLSLCRLMGIKMDRKNPIGLDARAERLCDAYWTFRYLHPQASISFEHMLLLLAAAERGDELALVNCSGCEALMVVDSLALHVDHCPQCAQGEAGRGTALPVHLRRVAEERGIYE